MMTTGNNGTAVNTNATDGAAGGAEVDPSVLEADFAAAAAGESPAGGDGAQGGDDLKGKASVAGDAVASGGDDGGGDAGGDAEGDGGDDGDQGGGDAGAAVGGGDAAGDAGGAAGGAGDEPDPLDAYLKRKDDEARQRRLDALLREQEAEAARRAAAGTGDAGAGGGPAALDVNAALDALAKNPALANLRFGPKDEALSFQEMREQYPAVVQLSAALAQLMAAQQTQPIVATIEEQRAAQATERLIQTLAGERYGHTDVEQIAQSDAFWTWVGKQQPLVQELAVSLDADDVDMVLQRYRKDAGLQKPDAASEAASTAARTRQTEIRTREAGLHSGTIRTRKQHVATGGGESTEADVQREMEEAWREEEEADRAKLKAAGAA